MKVGIVDFGFGNLKSLERALSSAGFKNLNIIDNGTELHNFDLIFLPGVGVYSEASEKLKHTGLGKAVKSFIRNGGGIVGICLGMQLFSECGNEIVKSDGLALIEGEVKNMKNLPFRKKPLIPLVNWMPVKFKRKHEFYCDLNEIDGKEFYFIHSYYFRPTCEDYLAATYRLNGVDVPAIVGRGNIIGLQFHPEKSGLVGLKLLSLLLNYFKGKL